MAFNYQQRICISVVLVLMPFTGHGAGQDVIESALSALFTNCSDIKNFLNVSYEQLSNSASKPHPANISLLLYGSSVFNQTWISLENASNTLWNNPLFKKNQTTEILIHGFVQNYNFIELNAVLGAFIAKGNRNVILVNAQKLIGFWYMYASSTLKFIGRYLGEELVKLVGNGYDKSKIHLTGFSMGAHIVGFTGKAFKNITGESLPWITGLDPAGPCFYNSTEKDRLDASDADFVDVIHSDMGVWGTVMQIGHADFYPNGGDDQPGAITPVFSHLYALLFYVESIFIPSSFPCVSCKNYDLFRQGACSSNPRTNMGYGVSKTARGKYYLKTRGIPPYNMGLLGIPAFNYYAWIASLA